MIPVWFKLAYTTFACIVLVTWLRYYGWRNLLWFSDIALFGTVAALWLESAALASVLSVAVLGPELLWNLDLLLRLLLRRRISGMTEYMFERERLPLLRWLSLFHVPLPLVLLWMIADYGYRPQVGLSGAALLAAVVLPLSRACAPARDNINWSHGPAWAQQRIPGAIYLALLLTAMVLLLFLPTHLALARLFPAAAG